MNYWLAFGSTAISGLNPTFVQWRTTAGGTLAPPSISEPGSFGKYMFSYNALTQICFVADGATTLLAFNDRYITGVVDPSDNFGFTLSGVAATLGGLGATVGSFAPIVPQNYSLSVQNYSLSVESYSLIAQGFSLGAFNSSLIVSSYSLLIANASLVGTTGATYGGMASDPFTVFGFLKRAQELTEGNEVYTKATGVLDSYARGTSTILLEKTISDSLTETTKT